MEGFAMKPTTKALIFSLAVVTVGVLATAGTLLLTGPTPQTLTSGPAVVGKTITTGTAREVIGEYLKSFDSRIVGLTGTQAQVDSVVKEYRVYAASQKTESGDDYLVSHSAYVYLMNPQGTFVNVISGGASGEEIAAWLRKEMARPTG